MAREAPTEKEQLCLKFHTSIGFLPYKYNDTVWFSKETRSGDVMGAKDVMYGVV